MIILSTQFKVTSATIVVYNTDNNIIEYCGTKDYCDKDIMQNYIEELFKANKIKSKEYNINNKSKELFINRNTINSFWSNKRIYNIYNELKNIIDEHKPNVLLTYKDKVKFYIIMNLLAGRQDIRLHELNFINCFNRLSNSTNSINDKNKTNKMRVTLSKYLEEHFIDKLTVEELECFILIFTYIANNEEI